MGEREHTGLKAYETDNPQIPKKTEAYMPPI